MDPLSVAASVVGLATAAERITTLLYDFINNANDAPDLVRDVMAEVNSVNSVICGLQTFLRGNTPRGSGSREREAMITVENLVVTLTGCVHTFSELSTEVNSLEFREGWGVKEEIMSRLFQRLQTHNSSLTLMLAIFEGEPQDKAEKNSEKLCALATEQMEVTKDMSARLKKLEATLARSMKTLSSITLPGISRRSTMALGEGRAFDFDTDLQHSRVYKRSFWRRRLGGLKDSHSSITVKTMGWSYLSGLSLADISHISLIDLPVYACEISNSDCYSFGGTTVCESDDGMSEATSIINHSQFTFKPLPAPPASHQKKTDVCQQILPEPHPHLSFSDNPKELEIYLNELWANAYHLPFSPVQEEGSEGSVSDSSSVEGKSKCGSDNSNTSFGNNMLRRVMSWVW